MIAAVFVKPFGVAKARLEERLSAERRAHLGMAIAARTLSTAADAGADVVVVVTADPSVARWAAGLGFGAARDPGDGLNAAAAFAHSRATEMKSTCVLLHADLPVLSRSDMVAFFTAARHGPAIAPSYDGGTSAISAPRDITFSYGKNSFSKHLAQMPRATVVVRPGLALDLDTSQDLDRALAHPGGDWLRLAIGE